MKKKLRTIIILLLLILIVIQYSSLETSVFGIFMDTIGIIIMLLITALAMSLLIAIVPNKEKRYSEKFQSSIPVVFAIFLIGINSFLGFNLYLKKVVGKELHPLRNYDDIQIPRNLDCSDIHSGTFETEYLFIKRAENTQVQKNKKTGEINEFVVKWVNNCEYILTSTNKDSVVLRIKILEISEDGYIGYLSSSNQPDLYPTKINIKRTH